MKKLNKRDFIDLVSEEVHLSLKEAEAAVDFIFEKMEEALSEGREINITNFGIFTPKTKGERIGTNPKTHEQINIAQKRTVVFHASKTLKAKLNRQK